MTRVDFPTGLVGVEPARGGAGVRATVGIRSNSGEPILKDRFFLMNPVASPAKFQMKNGGEMKGLRSHPHPSFTAWNEEAKRIVDENAKKQGVTSRCGAIRGNLIHARLPDAAEWNAAAQKLPGLPSPPSQRPACCGDGVRALRFSHMEGGEEIFKEIACPNELCEFRQSQGTKPPACKASATLVFRLRWNPEDPLERDLPGMVCTWHTRSPQSLSRLMALFEFILGTERVAPSTPRDRWKAGLAADLGVADPSLVGLPFVMSVSEKSKNGHVFPIVSFSLDGDPVQWLLAQKSHRNLLAAGGPPPLALPVVSDPEVRHVADLARAEWEVVEPVEDEPPHEGGDGDGGPEGGAYAPPWGDAALGEEEDHSVLPRHEPALPFGPEFLPSAKVRSIREQAELMFPGEGDAVALRAAESVGADDLRRVPDARYADVLRFFREEEKRRRSAK